MYSLLQTSVGTQVQLELELATGLDLIEADRKQIEQVVLNLVVNAAESSERGPSRISISTRQDELDNGYLRNHTRGSATVAGPYAIIAVRDDGPGMAPEVLDKIFEPFFTTKFFGRGLGLAAVFGILRLHQAAIEVESKEGSGSCFRVLFPAQPDAVPFAIADQPEMDLAVIPALSGRGGRILVIDDEEGIRDLAREAMAIVGFEVMTAENGRRGLSLLRTLGTEVECVLLDMTMPGMDGAATFCAIRNIAPELPTVIMSGYNESQVLQQFPADQRPPFLHKPFTIEQLNNKVLQAISIPV